MRNLFVLALMIFFFGTAFGQRTEVLKAFEKYKINPTAVDSIGARNAEHYIFYLQTTIVTDASEKVELAKHDPTRPAEERWQLLSVNGNKPSKLDLNTFRKQHDQHIPPLRPDVNTYKIVKDDGKELVISYQYDPASLVADNAFMKACLVKLYFDTQTARLKRMESEIAQAFKVKMFKGDHMNANVTYTYREDDQRYLPLKEEVSITLKLLGRPLEMTNINEYSNYKKP